jgi:hypothetical protein
MRTETFVHARRSWNFRFFRSLRTHPPSLPPVSFSCIHDRSVRSFHNCIETKSSTLTLLRNLQQNRSIASNTPPGPLLSSTTSDSVIRAARPASVYQHPNHAHVIESCERLHNSVMNLNNRVSMIVIDCVCHFDFCESVIESAHVLYTNCRHPPHAPRDALFALEDTRTVVAVHQSKPFATHGVMCRKSQFREKLIY